MNAIERFFRHRLKKHFNGKIFECHCGSVYTAVWKLKYHQRLHNNQKMTCDACQNTFASIDHLKYHCRRMKHGQYLEKSKFLYKVTKQFTNFCFRFNSFGSATERSVHLRQMWSEDSKPSFVSDSQFKISSKSCIFL